MNSTLAEKIAFAHYGISGKAQQLDGYTDLNFKISAKEGAYILKISHIDSDIAYLSFQNDLLLYIENQQPDFLFPKVYPNKIGSFLSNYTDEQGNTYLIRLLTWIEGRMYYQVNPKTEHLDYTLGQKCGAITACLQGFTHDFTCENLEWDIANALWVEEYLPLFSAEKQKMFSFYLDKFKSIQNTYKNLRKSTVHNDANEHNIVVSSDLQNPETLAIIDYGDTTFTQTINDVAVLLAYGMMEHEQPLQAAAPILAGYQQQFPLQANELKVLYVCVAMRLLISLTKSAIARQKEPENTYIFVSEKTGWALLEKWYHIPENFAYYCFRQACGFPACEHEEAFTAYAKENKWLINNLLGISPACKIAPLDLSIDSPFVGNFQEYKSEKLTEKIQRILEEQDILLVGGYGEARPIYTTDAYKVAMNEGFEYRTIHLGTDFWTKTNT
ncbi:MAG: phosphotransferase, partial [Bacteroidia bacterium]